MPVELLLNRIDRQATYTGGTLSVQKLQKWVSVSDTLEDTLREFGPNGEGKVWGKTAIPAGRYRVKLTFSNRFKKVLPELKDVPFFSGIRIHIGNWATDTDGCILVGLKRKGDALVSSRSAMKLVMELLEQADRDNEAVYITIVNS